MLADCNLDPGGGAFSAGIAAHSEDSYVNEGHAAGFRQLRNTGPTPGVHAMVGSLQIADPLALYRSARSLVEMPRPTVREQLAEIDCPRSFLVGSRTLEAEGASAGPQEWPYTATLLSVGVRVFVVPDAGHGMMWDNPAGFARVLAQALAPPQAVC